MRDEVSQDGSGEKDLQEVGTRGPTPIADSARRLEGIRDLARRLLTAIFWLVGTVTGAAGLTLFALVAMWFTDARTLLQGETSLFTGRQLAAVVDQGLRQIALQLFAFMVVIVAAARAAGLFGDA
jgi:hypothetical protein